MTKLRELWNKTKEALSGGSSGGGQVAIRKAGEEGEHLSDRPLAEPAADIFEGATELQIVADVPGARQRDTIVSLSSDNTLVLYARVSEQGAERPMGGEFRASDWYRSFRLPAAFDGDRARASLEQGVLTIRVPRRKESAPKLIPVKARG